MNRSPILSPVSGMPPFQINRKESQKDADENEVALFLKASNVVAKIFDDVISNPAVFFDLPKIKTPQFKSVNCAISSDDQANIETRLNFVYTSKEKATRFHNEKIVLGCCNSQTFGFREVEIKDRATVILSFPNNKLFNALLHKLPSIFSFAIQSTYKAVGQVSPKTHVTKWIESSSWPYDGDANDLMRLKDTFHDAHHIIRSLQSNHLLANILLFLKSRLKEKDKDQLFENEGARQLSNELEILHNEASDLRTKHFDIIESEITPSGFVSTSDIFNGVMNPSDFPMKLKETEEDFKKRCRLEKKIFPYQKPSLQYVVIK